MPPPEIIEAVVAALLAVNNYPLEKAWSLLPQLRAAELTNPFICGIRIRRRAKFCDVIEECRNLNQLYHVIDRLVVQ